MEQDLNKQLSDASEKKHRKEKLTRDLTEIQQQLIKERKLLDSLSVTLLAEKKDVDRLEGMSLQAVMASFLGNKEEKLSKERQDLLRAKILTHQKERTILALEQDLEHIHQDLGLLESIDQEYEYLLQAKEKQLLESNPAAAREILEFSVRISKIQSEIKEVDEAISAGETVLKQLDQALSELQSARDMGTWDLLGGGFLTTMIKHNRMDDARASIEQVQIDLLRFKRELADVHQTAEMQIELEPLERFADMFLDGLIIDWIVQSKINNSLEQVVQMRAHIQDVSAVLQNRKKIALQTINDYQNKKSDLIEKL